MIDEHLATVEIDAVHSRHACFDVEVALHNPAQVRRNVIGREAGGRNLIEQR